MDGRYLNLYDEKFMREKYSQIQYLGPKFPEHLEVFLKHRPRPHSVFSRQLETL